VKVKEEREQYSIGMQRRAADPDQKWLETKDPEDEKKKHQAYTRSIQKLDFYLLFLTVSDFRIVIRGRRIFHR
jgi:hypothetical protein